MNKLAYLALAATVAVLPAAASAQVTSPGPAMGGSGPSFQGGTMHGGSFQGGTMHGGSFQGGSTFVHGGPGFHHQRFQRGFVMAPFFWGPQFHVQNWQLYGFAQPSAGQRWVRYYDDAYLVDQQGRVQDSRHGLDWDEYGERWTVDDGIPHYEGRGEWRPGEQDHAWFRQHGHSGGQGYAAPAGGCMPAASCGGYGYGGGYGYYGYGVAYPIIIETTVTGGGCGCTYETVTEEVVEVRHHHPRPRPRRPAPRPRPRPPAGERG
ncbi:MAG: RcnB family protein [Allosphingosinicella sp.]